MRVIIKENMIFFMGYGLFLFLCLIVLSAIDQGDGVRYFSEHRTAFGDAFFRNWTKVGEQYFYLFFAFCALFIRFRYSIMLFFTGVSVALISIFTKDLFSHHRPSVFFHFTKEFEYLNLVEGVELLTGPTSFPSGHTMSAFALYGLLAFLCTVRKPLSGLFFLVVAILIGLSRIYLVQHFLKDIFAGSIIGIMIALSFYYLHLQFPVDSKLLIDRSLLTLFKKSSPAHPA